MNSNLYTTWKEVTSVYSTERTLIEQLWNELQEAYTSKSRHYHNLQHIEAMMRLAEQHEKQLQSSNLLKFAIFYHDAVYKASKNDNEEKSAQLAKIRLKTLGMSQSEMEAVEEMILATKTHQTSSSPDVNLLLDFDLSLLGSIWEKYLLYSQQIRKEYSLYPDFLYNNGRKKVLRNFLEKESIFKTEAFKTDLEQQARQNLEKELQLLDS